MVIRKIKLFVLSALLFFACGCVYLVVGGIGAVGGYVVSPDTVEGLTQNKTTTVWENAVKVLSIMGTIVEKDQISGVVTAKLSGSKVDVRILSMGENTVKLSVKARKAFLPKIALAQDVFVKIMSQVND
ncbi:MAG: hypothetical protein HQL23_06990 [Candidatus Omnitrophica bacterium]|nr:hypothetical protein [Candidatus Omnitrophota bacterium]